MNLNFFFFASILFMACANGQVVDKSNKQSNIPVTAQNSARIIMGAEQLDLYLPKLKGKSIGLVANQTATIRDRHLADTLLSLGVNLKTIFSPEHGFRGNADAGAKVKDGKDPITGLPIYSLYGKNRKPTAEKLKGIDLMLFDIQDVGVRFYTYMGTLHYVLEACAENGIPILILDRPNPNGHYVDGPILDMDFKSFVGMHPVPIVHGMTIGEYGQMIVGESWLKNNIEADLSVIACKNYDHKTPYTLPLKPSPNLPNAKSVLLYPSLCLFEGTEISIGRGTNKQFQIYGHPEFSEGDFTFTPKPLPGAMHPKLEGKACKGFDISVLSEVEIRDMGLNLHYLLSAYADYPKNKKFFLKNNFFNKLAGGSRLKAQIIEGLSESEIRKSWQPELDQFKNIRQQYLLYK